jgi:hypothetical protein
VFTSLFESRRNQVVAGVLTVMAITVAGVLMATSGGGDEASPATTTSTTTTTVAPTTTTVPAPVAPLTGLEGSFGDRLDKAALVVKIDNDNGKARPQVGLNEADVVYEERVEGSVTRLLAVFHSSDSVPVGPVRSARTSDIAIFSALQHPYFAWSGANATFAQRIRQAAAMDVGYDVRSGEYFREGSRRAPSNLMLRSTAAIRALPNEGANPPKPLWSFRGPGEAVPHLEPAEGAAVSFGRGGGAAPSEWRWQGTGWARTQAGTPHVDVAGRQVRPANVVIQFVDYVPSDTADQFGVPIPEADLVGEGEVWVLTGGGTQPHGVVKGRWMKDNTSGRTTYTDVDGNPILLTPGRTWVVLPSPGGARLL